MAKQPSPSLLAQLHDLVHRDTEPVDALVPLDEFPMYYLIASEIARMATGHGDPDLCLLVDSQTAMQVDAVDAARAAARHTFVFGPPPATWASAENVVRCPGEAGSENRDLFLVALSRRLSLGLVCEQRMHSPFAGAWTGYRAHARGLAKVLLDAPGVEAPPGFALPSDVTQPDDGSLTYSMRLMSLLARQLDLRHRDMAMDKDDLFGVLSILKAISAKRRAHDILYVFVEHIARAVKVDRCSVVRVWGEEDRGHVLASHEDERVSDLPIDLTKYPELHRAIETRQKVIINDTRRDPLTRPYIEDLERSGIHSLLVIPVVLFDQSVGSLLLRAARHEGAFTLREISFCEIVAGAAANALERAQLFEEIQKANERLERLAVTDGLTGLYNHRYFRMRLADEFERAKRYELPLSCMIMDIDNFKKVNDTFGHLQGDAVLRGIAQCTTRSVRRSDIVARYGGEEFVVVMPQTGIEGATAQAERVRREISGTRFQALPEGATVTVSVGVAIYQPEIMNDCEALIRAADSALYQAKSGGKNRVVMQES